MPEWYLLPFYAILAPIPDKLLGVIALFSSVLILLFVPWLDTSRVKSATYRPLYRQFFWLFVVTCVLLGWLGSKPPDGGYVIVSRLLTAWYFIHFLIVLPLLGLIEQPKPLPSFDHRAGDAAAANRGHLCLPLGLGASALARHPTTASAQVSQSKKRRRATPGRSPGFRRLRHRPVAARLQGLP